MWSTKVIVFSLKFCPINVLSLSLKNSIWLQLQCSTKGRRFFSLWPSALAKYENTAAVIHWYMCTYSIF